MSELPAISGKVAIKLFKRLGFEVVRTKGSHHVMKKEGHQLLLTVPVHGNQSLKKGTLKGLISAAGISDDDAVALLDEL